MVSGLLGEEPPDFFSQFTVRVSSRAQDIARALSELVPQNSFGYVQVAYACTT
jgi:hypothetical protein